MGIGYVIVAQKEAVDDVLETIAQSGERAWVIGEVSKGEGGVVFCRS